MNYDWKKLHFDDDFCNSIILPAQNGNIIVKGHLKINKNNVKLVYWAANPADLGYSVSGSGLPFYSAEQAFSGMINVGSLISDGKSFEFKLYYPNSYYIGLGSVFVPPQVYIKICDPDIKSTVQIVKLGNPLPYKSLTHKLPTLKNHRHDALFYKNNELTIRTQEQILRDSSYPSFNIKPSKMPGNFWGLKPPV